jgi:LPXTG-motif cell wall-anchored protein
MDNGAMAWTIGAVSATLLALGAGLFFVRRRLS